MKKILILLLAITLVLSENLSAQKDVTKFLGIPVDGLKSEMIQKLKSKGYIINPQSKDILSGEFNGTDVNIVFVTNNNKVWRIGLADVNTTDEVNIKIRFNNLVRQFQNNMNYLPEQDSTIVKYIIPENEDISYEMLVHKKRYEAIFYQKTAKYDSLVAEKELLESKENLTEDERKRLLDLTIMIFQETLKSFDKTVWFMISESYGNYYISMFYENIQNKANGDGL